MFCGPCDILLTGEREPEAGHKKMKQAASRAANKQSAALERYRGRSCIAPRPEQVAATEQPQSAIRARSLLAPGRRHGAD